MITDSSGIDRLLAARDEFLAAARDGDDLVVRTTSGTARVTDQFAGDAVIDEVVDTAGGCFLSASALATLLGSMWIDS